MVLQTLLLHCSVDSILQPFFFPIICFSLRHVFIVEKTLEANIYLQVMRLVFD